MNSDNVRAFYTENVGEILLICENNNVSVCLRVSHVFISTNILSFMLIQVVIFSTELLSSAAIFLWLLINSRLLR